MRRVGIALLGLLGGLLAGVVLQDLLAPLLITGPGDIGVPGVILLPLLLPAGGLAGVVLALVLDARRGR